MSEPDPHVITVDEAPYFSTPVAYFGVCSCGLWRSVKTFTRAEAETAGAAHVAAMAIAAADSALLADPAARLRIIREGLDERLPGPDSDPRAWLAWAERRATTGELMRYHAMATHNPEALKAADATVRRAHAIMREQRDLLGLPEHWQSRPINLPGHGDAEG